MYPNFMTNGGRYTVGPPIPQEAGGIYHIARDTYNCSVLFREVLMYLWYWKWPNCRWCGRHDSRLLRGDCPRDGHYVWGESNRHVPPFPGTSLTGLIQLSRTHRVPSHTGANLQLVRAFAPCYYEEDGGSLDSSSEIDSYP